jgi:transposase
MMQAIIERCCGLDVHQETVVACLLVGAPGTQPTKEVRTFRTVTRELVALRDWLAAAGVTQSAWKAPASPGGQSTPSWKDIST